jgi:ABC-type Fe3+/spermidine/putrescine transport system ATPase subunit
VTPLLQGLDLVRRYGDHAVLQGVTITVQQGELLCIVGPNGAGKSTLFRVLLGLERPDAGEVRIAGRRLDATSRRRVAGVFQRPIFFTGSVRDNVAYGLRARRVTGAERTARTDAALHSMDLARHAGVPVHALSGGEAQRVALARALAIRPDVLLLDEPTANLDISISRRFRHDLERAGRAHAGAIVLITHDTAEAFGLADRVVVMDAGRIVQDATPAEVMLQPATPFVAELAGAELLLHGVVAATDEGLARICLGNDLYLWGRVAGVGLPTGSAAVVAYRPEDIALAPAGAEAVGSAVNRIPVRIARVVHAGAVARVLLEAGAGTPVQITALATRHSMDSLELTPGAHAVAVLKATALHAWADPRAR